MSGEILIGKKKKRAKIGRILNGKKTATGRALTGKRKRKTPDGKTLKRKTLDGKIMTGIHGTKRILQLVNGATTTGLIKVPSANRVQAKANE